MSDLFEMLQDLFDALPDVVFFVKDSGGRYTHANLTLLRRVGLKRRDEVVGRSVMELFTPALGSVFAEQDRRVLAGERLDNLLEVHLFRSRAPGWCLTSKRPLLRQGKVSGLIGISRDLSQLTRGHPSYDHLRTVTDYLHENFGEPVSIRMLAELAGISIVQLERIVRRVFQVTPQQLLAKFRVDAAMRMLAGKSNIAEIGVRCGFTDPSAFARQFKAMVGMTPSEYRRLIATTTGAPKAEGIDDD